MTQEPPKVIAIPVPAAMHTAIGVVLALITITAFWTHLQFPTGHANKGTALGLGILVGCVALTYWIWCGQQCARTETQGVGEAVAAAEAKAAEREAELTAALQAATEQLDKNHEIIKTLIGAVEALQDTYLAEGKPPSQALQPEGPVPGGGTGPSPCLLHLLGGLTGLGSSRKRRRGVK